ncbi:restriction endonuclease [Glutamicibacter ardleyensis]|uniref:restriction endonuclease n=1 Tax=Glutamicibacter ardleyensis TaxID=225894 RepID=UPI003FD6B211
MIDLLGLIATRIAAHLGALESVGPSPSSLPATCENTAQSSSWIWQFSTGPALAGVLALAAAFLAFVRLGHQITETRNGNQELARRNEEEQWWDTLKWTYVEAKDSLKNDGPFQTVAAVRILDSLNQDNLTDQQKRAVESIMDIFGESEKPEVIEAVTPLYEAFGKPSPPSYFVYEEQFSDLLQRLNLGTLSERMGPRFGSGFDFLVESGEESVAILLKMSSRPIGVRAVRELIGSLVTSSEANITAALIVTPHGLNTQATASLKQSPVKIMDVQWELGAPAGEVEKAITELLKG